MKYFVQWLINSSSCWIIWPSFLNSWVFGNSVNSEHENRWALYKINIEILVILMLLLSVQYALLRAGIAFSVRNGKHDSEKKRRNCIEDVKRKMKKRKERFKSIVKLACAWWGMKRKMSKKHEDWFPASSELLKKWKRYWESIIAKSITSWLA